MFFYFRIFRFVMISWIFSFWEEIDWGQNKDLYLSSLSIEASASIQLT